MSGKFNTTKKRETVKNYMGHTAYTHSPKVELVNAVLASFIEDTYYEKASKRLSRINGLVEEVAAKDPVFVAKLAVYARDEFNMRSSYHALVGELAKAHRGDGLVASVIAHAVRPDDLTEIVSYVGKPVPNQVKKGVARALANFDRYQLGKYQAGGKEFSLRDLVRMVHPKPGQGREELYQALAAGELRNKETWESRLSAGEKKETVFKDLLANHKLGYMATLRNLRNILETGDQETVALAARFISNPKAVANSRQLPFRFLSAYEAVQGIKAPERGLVFEKDGEGSESLVDALERALELSVQNIPLLTGKTLILSDNSGSMRGDSGGGSALSAYSKRKSSDIANLFALLYWSRAENTAVGLFGDRLVQPKLDREASIFENFKALDREAAKVGPGTEHGIFTAFEDLVRTGEHVDRIVIFSDMQIGKNSWYGTNYARTSGTFNKLYQAYKTANPDTFVYSIDLKGYGSTVFGSNVLELSGWSDKIFDVMSLMETDRKALIHQIEAVEL